MRLIVPIAALLALAVSGCSGNKDAGKIPEEKRVGNFVYAPPPGANGKAGQPGKPGVPQGSLPNQTGGN
jgi:hypothetical protein